MELTNKRLTLIRRLLSSDASCAVFVLVLVYAVHVTSGVIASSDSRWVVPSAKSLIDQGNLDLDEFPDAYNEDRFTRMEQHHGHWYSGFPIGMPLLATPFVYLLDRGSRVLFHYWPHLEQRLIASSGQPVEHITVLTVYWRVELIIATFFIAVASVLMYLAAREVLDKPRALLIAFLFAFCTAAWSTGSRSLGQQTGSMLMLNAVLLLALHARKRPWVIQLAALPVAFAYVVRPTNSLVVAFFTVFVALRYTRYLPAYLGWAFLVAVPWLTYNRLVYESFLPSYYSPGFHGIGVPSCDALTGLLISPSRGLLIFDPLVVLSIVGFALKYRKRELSLLDACVATIIVLHWIVISGYGAWWGGHSYGPRLFVDMVPLFMYLLFPVIANLRRPFTPGRRVLVAATVVLAAWGFFVNYRGATNLQTWAWNRDPINVDDHPEHVWDWSDPQFLRGL